MKNKKNEFMKSFLAILTAITILMVILFTLGNEIKVAYITFVLNNQPSKFSEYLISPIKKYSETIFFEPLVIMSGSRNPDYASACSDYIVNDVNIPQCYKKHENFLRKSLKNNNSKIRYTTIAIMGKSGDKSFIPFIREALKDSDASVRAATLKELVIMEYTEAIDDIARCLDDPEPSVRYEAVILLRRIYNEKATVEPLIKALKDRNDKVRLEATEALKDIPDSREIEPLKSLIDDSNPDVSKNAIFILGLIGSSEATDALIRVVGNTKHSGRCLAIEALGKIGDKRAVDPIIKVFSENNTDLNIAAITALEKIGGKEAVKAIIQLLRSSDSECRIRAIEVVGKLREREAVPLLIECLRDKNIKVRKLTVLALYQMRDERTVVPLIKSLADTDEEVASKAAYTLGAIGDKRASDTLMKYLRKRKNISDACAIALSNIGDIRVVEPICKLLSESCRTNSPDKRIDNFVQALLHFGPDSRAVEPLIEALYKTKTRYTRQEIITTLGIIGDKRCIAPLRRLPEIIEKEFQEDVKEEKKKAPPPLRLKEFEENTREANDSIVKLALKTAKQLELNGKNP